MYQVCSFVNTIIMYSGINVNNNAINGFGDADLHHDHLYVYLVDVEEPTSQLKLQTDS